jgi:hypothetical protein
LAFLGIALAVGYRAIPVENAHYKEDWEDEKDDEESEEPPHG